jgi:hypothetical protein
VREDSVTDAVPAEIRVLITERHILSSENPKHYDEVLKALIKLFRPKDILQWFGVKNLQNLLWEQYRMNRLKPAVIETARKDGLVRLLSSIANASVVNSMEAQEAATQWFADSSERERVGDLLRRYNLSESAIDAKAFLLHADQLQTLEKMQLSNEARQYELLRQLEQERQFLIDQPTTNNNEV